MTHDLTPETPDLTDPLLDSALAQALRPPTLSQDFEARLMAALAMEPPVERSHPTAKPTSSPDDPETICAHNGSPQEECGLFELFFAGLAGYDPRLVARYAGPEAGYERKKLLRIGISIFIPAFVGLFTSYFFLGPYVKITPTRIVFPVIAALIILLMDSLVVTSMTPHRGLAILARCVISLCIGCVVAGPLLITLYKPTIDAQIMSALEAGNEYEQAAHETRLATIQQEYLHLDQQLQLDRLMLSRFTPAALPSRHLDGRAMPSQATALTPEEQAEKERLTMEVARLQAALTANDLQRKQTDTDILILQEETCSSQCDNPLMQAQALFELLKEHWFLRLKVSTLLLFLILTAITPALIIPAARMHYDDYIHLKKSSHYKRSIQLFDADHHTTFFRGTATTTHLTALDTTAIQNLARTDPLRRSAHYKIALAAEPQLNDTLSNAERMNSKPRTVLTMIVSALKTALWGCQTKFHSQDGP